MHPIRTASTPLQALAIPFVVAVLLIATALIL
jgi:hypothetical protein